MDKTFFKLIQNCNKVFFYLILVKWNGKKLWQEFKENIHSEIRFIINLLKTQQVRQIS